MTSNQEHVDPAATLDQYIRDLRQTYNLLRQLADRLHADLSITASTRAVLEFIYLNGPATVPRIAATKRVSRQAIQKLADSLTTDRLLLKKPNPMHRKSDLLTLSPAGRKLFAEVRRRERRMLKCIAAALPEKKLPTARKFMQELQCQLIALSEEHADTESQE